MVLMFDTKPYEIINSWDLEDLSVTNYAEKNKLESS